MSTSSDSNRTQLGYAREAEFGVSAPTLGNVQLHALRFTRDALVAEKVTLESEEIRSDRQTQELIRVGIKTTGTFEAELSLTNYDDLMEAALQCEEGTQLSIVVDFNAGFGLGKLTSNNTNVSDGHTVTIGDKVYTFKTSLTPTEGQVLIGADADGSLLNLIRAINHTGTPGTHYSVAAANAYVTADAAVSAHAFNVKSIAAGIGANSIATTDTSATLSWGAATLTGGGEYSATRVSGSNFAAVLGEKHVRVAGTVTAANGGIKTIKSVTEDKIIFSAGQVTTNDKSDAVNFNFMCYAFKATAAVVDIAPSGIGSDLLATLTLTTGTWDQYLREARFVKIFVATDTSDGALTDGNFKVYSTNGTDELVIVVTGTAWEGRTASGSTIDLTVNYIRTGTKFVTHVIEKYFADVEQYAVFTGQGIDAYDFAMEAQNKVKQTFTMMGREPLSRQTAIGSTPLLAASTQVVNTSSHIGDLKIEGEDSTNPVKTVSFKVANGLRERPVIGSLFSRAHGVGDSKVTGQIGVYFADATMFARFLNHTAFALEFPVLDDAGNLLNVYMPSVQSAEGTPSNEGKNTDVMQTVNFTALHHATLGYQLQIDRLPIA